MAIGHGLNRFCVRIEQGQFIGALNAIASFANRFIYLINICVIVKDLSSCECD